MYTCSIYIYNIISGRLWNTKFPNRRGEEERDRGGEMKGKGHKDRVGKERKREERERKRRREERGRKGVHPSGLSSLPSISNQGGRGGLGALGALFECFVNCSKELLIFSSPPNAIWPYS